jgi:hypothetical protein
LGCAGGRRRRPHAQDTGAFAVDPDTAERVLRLLGYETQQAKGGMPVRESAQITTDFPGSSFYLSLGYHAAVARDGMVFDNHHPDGVPGDQYPRADDVIVRVICMARDRAAADDAGGIDT